MALTTYHHGITATETSNITPIIKSVSMSTIALVSTSIDADDAKYPLDTPVLLTGITTDDVTKAGAKDTLLSQCLQTIKSIQNTNVVVLRLSEPVDVDTIDLLLSCQTSLGVTPKILIAPEIDTPAMTRKLVEIAKKRRAFVYASPRAEDGTLITVKEDIVAYRDTFAARELMLIDGEWGVLGKSEGSGSITCTPTDLEFSHYLLTSESPPDFSAGAHARFRVDDGEWVDYENAGGYWSDVLGDFIGAIPIVYSRYNGLGRVAPFHFIPDRWLGGYLSGAPNINREAFEVIRPDGSFGVSVPTSLVANTKTATIEFATSSGLGIDIVAEMLGGNKTASACAYATWLVTPE